MVPVGHVNIHHVEFGVFFFLVQSKQRTFLLHIHLQSNWGEKSNAVGYYINSVSRGGHWGILLFLFLWVYFFQSH